MKPQTPLPVITRPGEGRVLRAFGDEVTVMLSGEQTGGVFSMVRIVTPPGGGPPPHWHEREEEWFHVLAGRVEFFLEGEWFEVPPGTTAFMPRESRHSYRNIGDCPLVMIVHTAPAGFETFFERCAGVFNAPGGPDMARIVEISAEHGIFYLDA
jgi:quercetin dioxygenase-like cupin family protein